MDSPTIWHKNNAAINMTMLNNTMDQNNATKLAITPDTRMRKLENTFSSGMEGG